MYRIYVTDTTFSTREKEASLMTSEQFNTLRTSKISVIMYTTVQPGKVKAGGREGQMATAPHTSGELTKNLDAETVLITSNR